MNDEMCELEKAFWDWYLKIKGHRLQLAFMPLNAFLLLPDIQQAVKKLGELYRELEEKNLWQKL